MNMTYEAMTDATEKMMRDRCEAPDAMPPGEIALRAAFALAVLKAGFDRAKLLVTSEHHSSEYDRLAELVRELPASMRVLG